VFYSFEAAEEMAPVMLDVVASATLYRDLDLHCRSFELLDRQRNLVFDAQYTFACATLIGRLVLDVYWLFKYCFFVCTFCF
jgi:hypothetical protein